MHNLFARLGIFPSTFVLDPLRLCIHSQRIPLAFRYLGKEAMQSDVIHLGFRTAENLGWMGLEAHCCCTNSRRMPTICIAKRVKTIRFLNPVHSVRKNSGPCRPLYRSTENDEQNLRGIIDYCDRSHDVQVSTRFFTGTTRCLRWFSHSKISLATIVSNHYFGRMLPQKMGNESSFRHAIDVNVAT